MFWAAYELTSSSTMHENTLNILQKKKLCLLIKEPNIHKNCKKLEDQPILIVSLDWQDIY